MRVSEVWGAVTALDKKSLSFGEGTLDFLIMKPTHFLYNFEGTLDFSTCLLMGFELVTIEVVRRHLIH